MCVVGFMVMVCSYIKYLINFCFSHPLFAGEIIFKTV